MRSFRSVSAIKELIITIIDAIDRWGLKVKHLPQIQEASGPVLCNGDWRHRVHAGRDKGNSRNGSCVIANRCSVSLKRMVSHGTTTSSLPLAAARRLCRLPDYAASTGFCSFLAAFRCSRMQHNHISSHDWQACLTSRDDMTTQTSQAGIRTSALRSDRTLPQTASRRRLR